MARAVIGTCYFGQGYFGQNLTDLVQFAALKSPFKAEVYVQRLAFSIYRRKLKAEVDETKTKVVL